MNNLISQGQELLKGVKKQTQKQVDEMIKSIENFIKADNVFSNKNPTSSKSQK